ncbi:MAG: rhodanese-like domain-containing protein [Pseudomonadota bacterium]
MGSNLVSTAWLAEHLGHAGLRVLDASWYLDAGGRDAAAEFAGAHIPGAARFDPSAAAAPGAPWPHTLPPQDHFARYAGALGLAEADVLVVYDDAGLAPAARAWWMFKVFGHQAVHVLDGGLGKWRREGRALASGADPVRHATAYGVHFDRRWFADFEAVGHASHAGRQIADARPAARFSGAAAEPRPDLRRGHIPNSRSVPCTSLVDAASGTFLPRQALADTFARGGIDTRRPVICSCGSGVTACVLALALDELDNPAVAVYDGSWTEWATRTPTAAGA